MGTPREWDGPVALSSGVWEISGAMAPGWYVAGPLAPFRAVEAVGYMAMRSEVRRMEMEEKESRRIAILGKNRLPASELAILRPNKRRRRAGIPAWANGPEKRPLLNGEG